MDAAWNAAMASTRPSKRRVDAENPQVRMLARRIREALEEADRIDREITALLAGGRNVRMPRHHPRHRAEDRVGAGHRHKHRGFPGSRPPCLLLRHRPAQPPVGHLDIVGLPRPGRATGGLRTCSYSHATPWSGARTASASTTAPAGAAACATERRSKPSRAKG